MAISFDHIPTGVRVPLFYAEISNRQAGYLALNLRSLLIGPMTEDAAVPPNKPILITSASQARVAFGEGSVLGDMVDLFRANDSYGELWCLPVDPGDGTQAEGEVVISGSPTTAGVISLYIAGRLVRSVAPRDADAADIAAALVEAINTDPARLVEATAGAPETLDDAAEPDGGEPPAPAPTAAGDVTITLKALQPGELGNQIDLRLNFRGLNAGEVVPPGLTVTLTPMTGGAGVPDLDETIAAMGDDEYDYIGIPWSDPATLDTFRDAMNDVTGRWAWSRQVYGHVFTARQGLAADLVTFGRARNDQHMSILGYPPSPSPPWQVAGAFAAVAAAHLSIDPARPLQSLPLIGMVAPERGTRFTLTEMQSLLTSGITPERIESDQVIMSRAITTYQRNAWGQTDPSYLDVTTMATLAYIVRAMRQRILQKFPRSKLANDGTPLAPGQAVVTPRIVRAELIALYSELMSTGIVENMDAFKRFLIVERNPNDPNRIDVLFPPDLVNQLIIFASLVEFRLQYSATTTALAA